MHSRKSPPRIRTTTSTKRRSSTWVMAAHQIICSVSYEPRSGIKTASRFAGSGGSLAFCPSARRRKPQSQRHEVNAPMNKDAVATELLDALEHRSIIEPFTRRDRLFDNRVAYEISAEILRRRRARGEKPIGRKIGFTNRLIWDEYGVSAPMWGPVYDSTVTFLDRPIAHGSIGHLSQPRIEPEIILHFRDSPG